MALKDKPREYPSDTYLIISPEGAVDYTVKVTKISSATSYELSHSNDGSWTEKVRGKVILTMQDTGNEILFSHAPGKKIEYDKFHEMTLLIKIRQRLENSYDLYSVVKTENLMTI